MEQLFPTSIDNIDIADAYALADRTAPHLRTNMVASIDGAAVVDGKSKPLSSPEDRKVFHVLRSLADLILVGAGTMRKENYGPVNFSDDIQQQRRDRGLEPIIPVAVVSHSCNFDWDSDFFRDAVIRPIIITDNQGAANAAHGSQFADIISCGENEVDLAAAITELNSRGYNHILCEGGPSLNTDLLYAGVLDELCLTIAPVLTQTTTKTIFDGLQSQIPTHMKFTHIFREGDDIFLRVRPEHRKIT